MGPQLSVRDSRTRTSGGGEQRPDDIELVMEQLYAALGPRRADDCRLLTELLEAAGLEVVEFGLTAEQEWDETAVHSAERLEQRTYGFLIDFDEDRFESIVLPVARALRALPQPGQPRRRASRHRLYFCRRRED
jgi:hypothetical protein